MRTIALACLLALPVLADDSSDDYTSHVEAGKKNYLTHGNLYRATWEFREAIRIAPERPEAYRAMGACLTKAKAYDRGVFYLYEAIRRGPDEGLSHYWMGMAQVNAKRHGPAKFHLDKAKALLKEKDFPTKENFDAALRNIGQLVAIAEKGGGGKFDPAAVGAPAALMFEAPLTLYGEPPNGMGAAIEAGREVPKALLLVQAWDKDGRLVDSSKLALEWGCSSGLVKKDGGIAAGDKPGKEVLSVTDTASKLSARVDLAVIGPAARLELSPATSSIARNQRLYFEAKVVDAAGQPVGAAKVLWTATAAGLQHAESVQEPNRFFDFHRNSFEPGEGLEAPAEVTVTAKTADGGLTASAKVTVEKRQMDKLQIRAKAVAWENASLEEAMKKAAEQKKPLMVEITAGWCPLCKRFEEGPLSDERVGSALKDWLAVQIDADDHPELIERFGVIDLPMIALLTPRGTLVGSFGNNMEPAGIDPRTTTDGLLKALEDAKKRAPAEDAEEDKRLGESKDAGKLAALARWYYARIRLADALVAAREAVKADEAQRDDMAPFIVYSLLSLQSTDDAVKEAEAYLAKLPDGRSAAQVMYYLGVGYKRQKDEAKAKATWAAVQKKWPTSMWARRAAADQRK